MSETLTFTKQVRRVTGQSLGLIIPKPVVNAAALEDGDYVEVTFRIVKKALRREVTKQ